MTYVQRAGRPVAAVIYDAELADQERLIQAAAAAALLRVEQARLHADLQASTHELALSRQAAGGIGAARAAADRARPS